MSKYSDFILVTNPQDEFTELKEEEWRAGDYLGKIKLVPVTVLKESTKEFLKNISNILEEINIETKDFQVVQVEVSATVTVNGNLSLIAASTGGELEGGLKFVFERKKDQ